MSKTLIIAEAGVNHNGNLKLAKKLISVAKKMGADVIKFQIFKADKLTTAYTPKANYQRNSKFKNQFEMLKKLELSEHDFSKLYEMCKKKKLNFLPLFLI